MHCSRLWHQCVCVMDRLSLLLLPCLRSLGRQAPNHAGWVRPASWLHSMVLAGALVALLGGLATLSGAASSDLIASLLAGRADPGRPHARMGTAVGFAYTAQPPLSMMPRLLAARSTQLCCMQVAQGTAATERWRQWINRLPCYSQRIQPGERRPCFWQGARQPIALEVPAFSQGTHTTGGCQEQQVVIEWQTNCLICGGQWIARPPASPNGVSLKLMCCCRQLICMGMQLSWKLDAAPAWQTRSSCLNCSVYDFSVYDICCMCWPCGPRQPA